MNLFIFTVLLFKIKMIWITYIYLNCFSEAYCARVVVPPNTLWQWHVNYDTAIIVPHSGHDHNAMWHALLFCYPQGCHYAYDVVTCLRLCGGWFGATWGYFRLENMYIGIVHTFTNTFSLIHVSSIMQRYSLPFFQLFYAQILVTQFPKRILPEFLGLP